MVRWGVVVGLIWCWLPAQPLPAQVTIGAITGLSVSTHTFEGLDVNTLNSFVSGATVVIPVREILSMRLDALRTRKGANPVWELDGVTGGMRIDYVEIPILAHVDLAGPSPALHPSIYAGPAFSFATDCDFEWIFHGVPDPRTCEENGAEIKTFDWGLVVGGSLGFDVGPAMITVDARYNHGLGDINEHPEYVTKHRAVSLMGGVAFTVGGVDR